MKVNLIFQCRHITVMYVWLGLLKWPCRNMVTSNGKWLRVNCFISIISWGLASGDWLGGVDDPHMIQQKVATLQLTLNFITTHVGYFWPITH